jgi:hypothetical protein
MLSETVGLTPPMNAAPQVGQTIASSGTRSEHPLHGHVGADSAARAVARGADSTEGLTAAVSGMANGSGALGTLGSGTVGAGADGGAGVGVGAGVATGAGTLAAGTLGSEPAA